MNLFRFNTSLAASRRLLVNLWMVPRYFDLRFLHRFTGRTESRYPFVQAIPRRGWPRVRAVILQGTILCSVSKVKIQLTSGRKIAMNCRLLLDPLTRFAISVPGLRWFLLHSGPRDHPFALSAWWNTRLIGLLAPGARLPDHTVLKRPPWVRPRISRLWMALQMNWCFDLVLGNYWFLKIQIWLPSLARPIAAISIINCRRVAISNSFGHFMVNIAWYRRKLRVSHLFGIRNQLFFACIFLLILYIWLFI